MDANISHWLALDKTLPNKVAAYAQTRDQATQEHRQADIALSKARLDRSAGELATMATRVKALYQRSASLSQRADCAANQRWWLSQILRSHYRRMCVLKG